MLGFCLVLSGAAGLIYEVLWMREVGLVMGHTAYALSALLAAFLGGLALGAALAGRWAQRHTATVRHYVGLELLVAATALLVPSMIRLSDPLYGLLYRGLQDNLLLLSAAQFLLCALIMLVPSALMGMTLPVVVSILTPDRRPLIRPVGHLYAFNSFGGAVGAGLAGLLLLPTFGATLTAGAAAGLNLFAALFALFGTSSPEVDATSPAPEPEPEPPSAHTWPAPATSVLMLLYGLAGLSALVLQVGWSRLVTLSLGSTVYGFTITLLSFIFGLSAGSLALGHLAWVRRDPVRSLVALHAGVALFTVYSLPWLGGLPLRVAELMAQDLGFGALWIAQLALVVPTIFVPTFAMGAIFPLVTELFRRESCSSGRAVGTSYAANTVGSIIGSLVGGFLLIPAFGMRNTVLAAAGLSALIAVVYLVPAGRSRPASVLAFGAVLLGLVGAGGWLIPAWDKERITSAAFLAGYESGRQTDPKTGKTTAFSGPPGQLIDAVEGPTTVAAVRQVSERFKLLYIGGVSEAASQGLMHQYLAHQAMLLHPQAKRVLVVGLGAGHTLSSVLHYPVTQVDCLELSSEVVDMARRHFLEETHDALNDPRVHLHVGDGRNHLRHSGQRYDVIISQPSYPWMTGAARLFTKEYFEEIYAHLEDDGVAVVWFPSQSVASTESLLKTWGTVFENALLFVAEQNWGMNLAVGIKGEAQPEPAAIAAALRRPEVGQALKPLGIWGAGGFLQAMRPWPELDASVPLNTDDNGYVEFEAFVSLLRDRPR